MNFTELFRSKRWLFYDCEIIKTIGYHSEYQWCNGWQDYESMGISCIATYSNWDNAYRIFSQETLDLFQKLVNKSNHIIGFNSLSFDDKLCAANRLEIKTNYDLLSQVWIAAGLPPTYTKGITTAGYSLEKLARANFGSGKTGSGELAPILWQQGKQQAVKAYCMTDVYLSVELLKLGWKGELVDPIKGEMLKLQPLA